MELITGAGTPQPTILQDKVSPGLLHPGAPINVSAFTELVLVNTNVWGLTEQLVTGLLALYDAEVKSVIYFRIPTDPNHREGFPQH